MDRSSTISIYLRLWLRYILLYLVNASHTQTIHFKLNLPQVCTSNRFENMGTETQLLCSVYTNSRYIFFFSPRKFCCLFSLESIWNALRWLLTIVQFCGMSLTQHNNPLRIVKSNRRDGGPFFPKSCCRHCEKVYHFSIGVY